MAGGDRSVTQAPGGIVRRAQHRSIGARASAVVWRVALAAALTLLLPAGWRTPTTAQHAAAAGAGKGTAGPYLYWTNDGTGGVTIGRAWLDGSHVDNKFVVGGVNPQRLCGVAIAGKYLYWGIDVPSGGPTIGRAKLDGTGVQRDFINIKGGYGPVCGVAAYGRQIYWAAYADGGIGRANLDGTGMDPNFIHGLGFFNPICDASCTPSGVAVDGAHIYWGDVNSIGRANLDGTHVQRNFISGLYFPVGVAVTSKYIYWTDQDAKHPAVGRARLDGSAVQRNFIAGRGVASPCQLAVTDRYIFWGEYGSVTGVIGIGGALARANIDGTGVQPRFIPGLQGPCGIAVGP